MWDPTVLEAYGCQEDNVLINGRSPHDTQEVQLKVIWSFPTIGDPDIDPKYTIIHMFSLGKPHVQSFGVSFETCSRNLIWERLP